VRLHTLTYNNDHNTSIIRHTTLTVKVETAEPAVISWIAVLQHALYAE